VPTGDGVIIGGVYKGFKDLLNLGLIDEMPIMYAVQAAGSCAICRALEGEGFSESYQSHTVADSIAVDVPRNGYYALKYLRACGGRGVLVEDGEILEAQQNLASSTGLFAEPAASAALAGFIKEKDNIPSSAKVVLLVTGNGLKDIDAAMQGVLSGVERR
jgi:threonine synthase